MITPNPQDQLRQQLLNTTKIIEQFLASGDQSSANAMIEGYVKSWQQKTNLLPSLRTELVLKEFITVDSEMLDLKNKIRILACSNYPVLIAGESGTGKDLLAEALHGNRKGEFIAINCAGLPEHLIESELFGHEKGAFTGALVEKKGLFQAADRGTLFLDEIGELPVGLQAKLLRVLQRQTIRRVGGESEIPISCRIISATHQDLAEEMLKHTFRQDLYFRISTFNLRTKPIRERLDDVLKIIHTLSEGKIDISEAKLLEWLRNNKDCVPISMRWPGNIRDIQNLVYRYLVLGTKEWE